MPQTQRLYYDIDSLLDNSPFQYTVGMIHGRINFKINFPIHPVLD